MKSLALLQSGNGCTRRQEASEFNTLLGRRLPSCSILQQHLLTRDPRIWDGKSAAGAAVSSIPTGMGAFARALQLRVLRSWALHDCMGGQHQLCSDLYKEEEFSRNVSCSNPEVGCLMGATDELRKLILSSLNSISSTSGKCPSGEVYGPQHMLNP